jgi:hypothetical protein
MRAHATDAVSLVAGLAFAFAGALLLADRVDLAVRLRWLGPVALIAAAVAMLAALAGRRADR